MYHVAQILMEAQTQNARMEAVEWSQQDLPRPRPRPKSRQTDRQPSQTDRIQNNPARARFVEGIHKRTSTHRLYYCSIQSSHSILGFHYSYWRSISYDQQNGEMKSFCWSTGILDPYFPKLCSFCYSHTNRSHTYQLQATASN